MNWHADVIPERLRVRDAVPAHSPQEVAESAWSVLRVTDVGELLCTDVGAREAARG
ncbi:hypothetical protein ACFQZ4_43840 [Catellatospora coxensis]|uniref:Uncharacterized protein n=1 Tax=Catellatospora coxensis TaxID=310354 RepID=A0A8J3P747_9ACTN|nr:hypothetical protein [Catellatospora coxensis]GIG04226.1 hypothetical protein Cco03nite_09260 [Catellatospora coxensis]